jgi:hypothetical protein
MRQQSSDTEQPGLEFERVERRTGVHQVRQQFCQPAHRPDVVLVTKPAKQAFAQGLFPPAFSCPGGEFLTFTPQPDMGGLTQKFGDFSRPTSRAGVVDNGRPGVLAMWHRRRASGAIPPGVNPGRI